MVSRRRKNNHKDNYTVDEKFTTSTSEKRSDLRIAFVHDWLLGMRGGERVLEVLCEMYPNSDIFTLLYDAASMSPVIRRHRVVTSSLQRIPFARRFHRYCLPLYPAGARDLGNKLRQAAAEAPYDLVISISHCLAKNVPVPAGIPHLCYCLTPVRYIWDQYDAYFAGKRIEPIVRQFLPGLRAWDVCSTEGVSSLVGISNFICRRIEKVYGRSADVICPPVRTDWIRPRRSSEFGRGFITVNALVPYKNTKVIVEAFNELPYELTVVGSGPEGRELRRMARENIRFIDRVSDEQLAELYRSSKAMVFAAEEDFGMTPVEMQAAGRPVIAFGRGGALETVNSRQPNPSGLFFSELTAAAIRQAVCSFLDREREFTIDNCVASARRFSLERFQEEFANFVERSVTRRGEPKRFAIG